MLAASAWRSSGEAMRWRGAGAAAAGWLRSACLRAPITPDFNTSVNVHEHTISLREKRTARLKEMSGRTKGSLVPSSIQHVEEDEEHKTTAENLRKMGQERLTLEERKKRRRALDALGVPSFQDFLAGKGVELIKRDIEILQVNIGLYCNQACNHCHVESSPKRSEAMQADVAMRCIELLKSSPAVHTLDITGGAPELNPQFKFLVEEGRRHGVEVIDRCNLTVLSEPGQEGLASFLAENRVRIVASLPCYSEKNVDTQRGSGVFEKSIEGLMQLNQLGYGQEGSGLSLDLVYNPLGAFLPPEQGGLEANYKKKLMEDYGIVFNNLFTLSNMPIKRFADFLHRRGELKGMSINPPSGQEPFLHALPQSRLNVVHFPPLHCRVLCQPSVPPPSSSHHLPHPCRLYGAPRPQLQHSDRARPDVQQPRLHRLCRSHVTPHPTPHSQTPHAPHSSSRSTLPRRAGSILAPSPPISPPVTDCTRPLPGTTATSTSSWQFGLPVEAPSRAATAPPCSMSPPSQSSRASRSHWTSTASGAPPETARPAKGRLCDPFPEGFATGVKPDLTFRYRYQPCVHTVIWSNHVVAVKE